MGTGLGTTEVARATAHAPTPPTVRTGDLAELGEPVARLHDLAGVPLRTHARDLLAWARTVGQHVTVVLVEDETGAPVAAALLEVRVRRIPVGSFAAARLAGHATLDHQRLVALDDEAARALAGGIHDLLAEHTAWRCELELLPVGDPVVAELARLSPFAQTTADDPTPQVIWPTERTERTWAAKKTRQRTRTAQRRADESGRDWSVTRATEASEVLAALPATLDLRLERELELGRSDSLADTRQRAAHVELSESLAARGVLELWQLHVDGMLGAYLLAARDGDIIRLVDGRIHPDAEDLSPGVILHGHALQAWHADPAITGVDLGRGLTNFKRSLRTQDIDSEATVLWSHLALARLEQQRTAVAEGARSALRDARDRSPVVARAVHAGRRAQTWARAHRPAVTGGSAAHQDAS